MDVSLFLFFSLFLDEYVSLTELSEENMTTLNQRLQPLIRLLESRYPKTFGFGGQITSQSLIVKSSCSSL